MNDRNPDEEQSASDWLAAQFGASLGARQEQDTAPAADSAPPTSAPPVPPALVEPPLVEATPGPAAGGSWDQPTQMMDIVEPSDATPAPVHAPVEPVAAAAPSPTEADLAATELLGTAAVAQDAATTSALEALFADENFRDYTSEPGASQSPVARAAEPSSILVSSPTAVSRVERAPLPRAQKVLLSVAGGLVAVLALVALFLLGTRLPALLGSPAEPAPTESTEPRPSPSPSAVEIAEGPVAPGVWKWDELQGGECLEPLDDIWAEEFTVVNCAEPHAAQLVFRGRVPLPGPALAEPGTGPSPDPVDHASLPFPGTETLQSQLLLLCSAPGAIDLAAAGLYTDVQMSVSYPATSEQWDAGVRDYYCFVTRASGAPLVGSVAPATPATDAD